MSEGFPQGAQKRLGASNWIQRSGEQHDLGLVEMVSDLSCGFGRVISSKKLCTEPILDTMSPWCPKLVRCSTERSPTIRIWFLQRANLVWISWRLINKFILQMKFKLLSRRGGSSWFQLIDMIANIFHPMGFYITHGPQSWQIRYVAFGVPCAKQRVQLDSTITLAWISDPVKIAEKLKKK